MAFDLTPIDIFDPSSYPTRRDEDWKYSDLSRVLREVPKNFVPTNKDSFVFDEAVLVSNGRYPELSPLATARKVLVLHHVSSGTDSDLTGYQSEQTLNIEINQSVILFETYGEAKDAFVKKPPYAASTSLHFKLAEGASLTRVVILDEPEDAISIRRSTVETAPGSTFKQYVFSTGARFQRFETHVHHAGHGAVVEMHGAYLLKDKRHFDLTTRVTHADIDGGTQQLIKGLVKDSATAVFQGRILVEKGADGTNARMRHQALILNDGAHIRAKPELEIYADDVQCAHGNTIGALDEEALFFCMSRGMSEDVARGLLTHAFVLPVANQIADEELRATVLEFLAKSSEAFHAV